MAEKITVTFLGTGSAIPTANKNHPSTLITYKEHNFLFDCGEGTQRQFRHAKLSPMKVSKMFLTHWHGDHTLGIPGLLQTLAMNEYHGNLQIHGPRNTKTKVKNLLAFHMESYLKKKKDGKTNLTITPFEHKSETVFEDDEVLISCFPLDHNPEAIGYTFEIKQKTRIDKAKLKKLKVPNSPKLKDLANGKDATIDGKKIKAKDVTYTETGRKISYVLDTGYKKDIEKHVKGSDLLIIEATFREEEKDKAKEKKHLTAKQAATIAKNAKVKTLVLVHISQRYERSLKKSKDEAAQKFKGKIMLPHDLDTLIL